MSCSTVNLTSDHTFFGYWEITESFFEGTTENLGLNGIKLLLDESGDIIWFNDLFSFQQVTNEFYSGSQSSPTIDDTSSKYTTGNESADILFSCETFEVIDLLQNGPALLFGSFTGHHIEFKTNTFTPHENLTLRCEGWCVVTCKRIKKDQSIGQETQYTLLSAYEEKFFSDITIKSCDEVLFELHSAILRLGGFDCTSLINSSPAISSSTSAISNPQQTLANNFLSPPTIHLSTFNFSPNFVNHISNSFNCLTSTSKESVYLTTPLATKNGHQISSSDSNINSLQNSEKTEIFDFPPIAVQQQQHQSSQPPSQTSQQKKNEQKHKLRLSSSQILYKSPVSPFRVRSSPSPFLSLTFDTPTTPSSPLTTVSVLYDLSSDILMPIFHWLYSESLPPNLNELQLENLLKICATISPLNKMIGPCKKYLRLIRMKKVIIDILTDIHSCLNRMIVLVNPYYVKKNPSTLLELFKQCLRELSIGCALFLKLSQIFSKDTTILNRYQRNEIIKFIKTRIPIFISQIHQLLQNILIIFKSLQQDEKDELVVYLVPEIILALEVTTELLADLKNSLEDICKSLNKTKEANEDENALVEGEEKATSVTTVNANVVDKDLKLFLHVCEVKKLHDIYGKVSSILEVLEHKKITFNSMTLMEQQSTISNNIDHLMIEIPIIIERLEELSRNMDDKVGWKEFKFCFKFFTSHINGIVSKIQEHKTTLIYPILKLCKLVNKTIFTKKLIELDLLDKTAATANLDQNDSLDNGENQMNKEYNSYKINLFSNLCESPNAINSNLSKNALKLLHSGHLSDMEFEIVTTTSSNNNNNNNNNNIASIGNTTCSLPTTNSTAATNNSNDFNDYAEDKSASGKKEYHVFKAHRVIVAARCEWLKKALLSGMQEDINRKITIFDTSPVIFRRFLLYLYGAPIDKTNGVESICELMLLADRYSVDNLKEVCEQTLISMIDAESVVCLLSVSDRFNANTLKTSCLSYLSHHIELTNSEYFRELCSDLQNEVYELIQWRGRAAEPWSYETNGSRHFMSSSRLHDDPLQYRSRHSLKSPSRPSKTRSRKSSPSYHK